MAGARHAGLAEKPINGEAVRAEVERERCYQVSNYAVHHLGRLKGFNAGASTKELVTTAKWIEEFSTAINAVLERNGAGTG